MSTGLTIAVCGAGQTDKAQAATAEAVGRAVAKQGARVICGGLGGVMAAACRGAKSAGGTTIGILPGLDPRDANEWVDIPIVTGLAEGRNLLIIYNANGIIALPGGNGTLSEIAFALKTNTPVIDFGGWNVPGMIPATDSPKAVVTQLLKKIESRGGGR